MRAWRGSVMRTSPVRQRAACRLVAAWSSADRHPAGLLTPPSQGCNISSDTGQHQFVEYVIGRQSAQIVIARRDDHRQIKVGEDNEPLTSVAHGGDIARPPWSLG